MKICTILRVVGTCLALSSSLAPALNAGASVAVLTNRTSQPTRVDAVIGKAPPRPVLIPPGGSRPIFSDEPVRVRLGASAGREFSIDAEAGYEIKAGPSGALSLTKLNLGDSIRREWKSLEAGALPLADAGVVAVKIVVDDDEVRPRRVWEPALRKRIDAVSAVLQAHAGIRLKVVAFDTWNSDNGQHDFFESLAELEREVRPDPAAVVIGFSSQYIIQRGRTHMGGTRGALHSHIMLKERAPNVLETERVELLVHELGHYFGATHSKERTSVMRPVLGEGLQRHAGAQIHFDPANTLLMSMLAEEMRLHRIREMDDVQPETRQRMQEVYATLQQAMSDDPSAASYLQRLAGAGVRPLVDDARDVLLATVRAAKTKQQVRSATVAAVVNVDPLAAALQPEGDKLLERHVRDAALAAKQARPENGPRALLLALGIAMDDAGALQRFPIAATVATHLEGEGERLARIAAVGQPTMHGRPDLAKHFFVSGFLTVLGGSEAARAAGTAKEMVDAQGGSGFSFADLAADRAGIAFAGAVISGRLSLDEIAQRFTVEDFLPPVDDLQENMTGAQFAEKFGSLNDERFVAELNRIEARIRSLPAYRSTQTSPLGR